MKPITAAELESSLKKYPPLDPKKAGSSDKRVRIEQYFAWARERHAVYLRKTLLQGPRPWTKDAYLQSYRFCNVYREIDTVSLWVRKNIIEVFEEHQNLWFMLMLARYINLPESLQDLLEGPREAWPDGRKWDWRVAAEVLETRKKAGKQMVTGAYIVNSVTGPKDPDEVKGNKAKVIMYRMSKAWEARDSLKDHFRGTMAEAVSTYQSVSGFGPFLSYQAAVDLSYSKKWLAGAPDLNTFNSAGPGTSRGLSRIFVGGRRGQLARLDDESKGKALVRLHEYAQSDEFWPQTGCSDPTQGWAPLTLPNLSNCCCEIDKYWRLCLKEGEPRSRYSGGANSLDTQNTLF